VLYTQAGSAAFGRPGYQLHPEKNTTCKTRVRRAVRSHKPQAVFL